MLRTENKKYRVYDREIKNEVVVKNVMNSAYELNEIYTEGTQFLLDQTTFSITELNMLLTGNLVKRPLIKSNLNRAIQGYLLKNTQDLVGIKAKLSSIVGKDSLKGAFLDEKEVRSVIGKSKYLSLALNVLTKGVSLSSATGSSVDKNRATLVIMKAYREIKFKNKRYQSEVMQKISLTMHPEFSIRFVIQYLLGLSFNASTSLMQSERHLTVKELTSLELYVNAEPKAIIQLEDALHGVISGIESIKYCRNVKIGNLYKIANPEGGEKSGQIISLFFDHNPRAILPPFNELYEYILLLCPVALLSSSVLRSKYKKIAGESARLGTFDFCKAQRLINERGKSVAEAHKILLDPEEAFIPLMIFQRSLRSWLRKKSFLKYWSL